ncbi:MAG: WD40 repeat domain-containing protein [Gemmataceae bacterium]
MRGFLTRGFHAVIVCFCLVAVTPAAFGQPPTMDRHGDPLPEGAAVRLGSARLRQLGKDGSRILPAFSPDGRRLVTARGAWLNLWDVSDGRQIRRWSVSEWGRVGVVAFAPDGKRLAIAAAKGVGLIDLPDGREIRRWEPRRGAENRTVGWLGFLPDGRTLAAIDKDGDVCVAGVEPGSPARRAKYGNPQPLAGLSADGRMLTVWNQDHVDRWDLIRLERQTSVKFPYVNVFKKLRLRADGSLFAVSLKTGIEFWDPATGRVTGRVAALKELADEGLDFTPDGRQLGGVSRRDAATAVAHVWDVATAAERRPFIIPMHDAGDPVVSPDGRVLSFAALGSNIPLWDSGTGLAKFDRGGLDEMPVALAFAPDGALAAAGGEHLYCWDRAGRVVHSVALPFAANGIALDPAGRWAAVSGKGAAQLFEVPGRLGGRDLALPSGIELLGKALGVTSTGRSVVALDGDSGDTRRTRLVWDPTTRRLTGRWEIKPDVKPSGSSSTSSGFSWRPAFAGPYLVRLDPGWLSPFDSSVPNLFRQLSVHGLDYDQLLMSVEPAGFPAEVAASASILAAVSSVPGRGETDDGIVETWEVATGQRLVQCPGGISVKDFSRRYWSIAVSGDSRFVALARGETIVLRAVDGAEELLRRQADGCVACIAFSSDGRTLASGQEDGTVLLWDLSRATRLTSESRTLSAQEAEACWSNLGGTDVMAARKAMRRLAGDPATAVDLCRSRLKPVPQLDDARIAQLLADLDAPRFAIRQVASRELQALGERAAAAIAATLQAGPSTEVRLRLEKLRIEPYLVKAPEALRLLRGIELLHRIGTGDAQAALQALAGGDPQARATQAAAATLLRLAGRPPP